MDKLKNEIENLKKAIMKVENKEYKECFDGIYSVLNIMNDRIEELQVNQETMSENVQYLDKDISGIQDELFEDLSIEELDELEEKYIEVKCANCSNPIFIEKDALEKNEDIPCPYCKKNIKYKEK